MHLPYHESDHVLTLAYSVLTGGTRLEDVDRLRNDVPLMNGLGARLLPDPTTTGDFLRRFTEADIVALMDAINSVRPRLWQGRGADLLGEVCYLDVDGTIVATTGELKQGMDISYKGIWGYAPLLITLANTREVLYLVNRSGNAPSHADAATWIDKAIALVAPYAKRVCVRGDTDFSLTAHFDRWASQVDFVLGTDNIKALRTRAEALDPSAWQRLQRPAPYENKTGTTRARRHNRKQEVVDERGYRNLRLNYEDVAEFTYRPGKCQRDYRVVVLRKNISRRMPTQHRLRPNHEPDLVQHVAGQPVHQRREERPIGRGETDSRPAQLPLQDRQLVAQRQDGGVHGLKHSPVLCLRCDRSTSRQRRRPSRSA
jgi:Transposase DDE domain group 1